MRHDMLRVNPRRVRQGLAVLTFLSALLWVLGLPFEAVTALLTAIYVLLDSGGND